MNIKIILIIAIIFICFTSYSHALSITLNVPEKYSEVRAGEKIYFETEVKYPENELRKDLRIEYFIKDKNGVEITYLKVLKAIETQASFMENMVVPESTSSGKYLLSARLSDYGDLSEDVAVSFNVKRKYDSFQKLIFFGFIVAAIMFILIIFELYILIKKRR